MELWERIVKECGLGLLAGVPGRVTGGYQHKMYRLETSSGTYAVKLLNPMIMKRADAMENYRRAEQLEQTLEAQGIPLVPALERNGQRMQQIDGQYYYIFPWIEGKTAGWQEITVEQCRTAGRLLARIHKIEIKTLDKREFEPEPANADNDIALAEEKCSELAAALKQAQPLLVNARKEYAAARRQLPPVISICNGDMDSKNVLWENGKPLLIDLECLDYGNPFWETFQLALSWAGGTVCELDYFRLKEFLKAYEEEGKETFSEYLSGGTIDWRELYGAGFSWLDWLDYNVRRALGIECEDEAERQFGCLEAKKTLERIVYYAAVREELLEELEELD